MKSKKNLTRFTYKTASYEGWRMNIGRAGATFNKYFSDRKYGSAEASLAAAEDALEKVKQGIAEGKKTNKKIGKLTINKINRMLNKRVPNAVRVPKP